MIWVWILCTIARILHTTPCILEDSRPDSIHFRGMAGRVCYSVPCNKRIHWLTRWEPRRPFAHVHGERLASIRNRRPALMWKDEFLAERLLFSWWAPKKKVRRAREAYCNLKKLARANVACRTRNDRLKRYPSIGSCDQFPKVSFSFKIIRNENSWRL